MTKDEELIELQRKSLKVILLSQLLIEANDDIKGSSLYKGKIKQFGRQFIIQLGNAIQQTARMYQVSPEIYTNYTRNLEELVEKLATRDTHDMLMINQMHKLYTENKPEWDAKFGVQLEELS